MTFNTILIVGGGLIGSSIARAAKAYDQAKTVYITDNSHSACSAIERLGIADGVSEGQADYFASQADLVVLCVPPGRMGSVAEKIIPNMKSGAVLSDVGSIKGAVIEAVTPFLRDDITFIPAHPIAGTEYSGPEAGLTDMFKDRWCVLTPPKKGLPGNETIKRFFGKGLVVRSAS